MRPYLKKPSALPIQRLAARLTDLNNYLPLFLVFDAYKNMEEEKMNEILLHDVPNSWAKQSYLQGWYFGARGYRETYEMLKQV